MKKALCEIGLILMCPLVIAGVVMFCLGVGLVKLANALAVPWLLLDGECDRLEGKK